MLAQTELHTSLTSGVAGDPITLEIGIKAWGRIEAPHNAFYGHISADQIADWWSRFRTRLFAKNLRSVIGDTEVNDEIKQTIIGKPDLFWYYNNGITLIAKAITKNMVGGSDTAFGTFHCDDISIVNGAQTVGSIGKYAEVSKENLEKVFVPIKVISLQNGDESFGQNITRANNRQNRIDNRDFVTLDPEQNRIKTELAIEKIECQLRREETFSRSDTSFDLVESTTATACVSGKVNLIVQLKREIGKLWENIEKGPYKELFNQSISGLYIWRCVRAQRLIDKSLEEIVSKAGLRSGRDYGVTIHGNRLLAGLVFNKLDSSQLFAKPDYEFETIFTKPMVQKEIELTYEMLKKNIADNYANAMIPTLFKNQSKCKVLFELCNKKSS